MINNTLNINNSFDLNAETLTASNTPSIYEKMKEKINNSYNEYLTTIYAIYSTSDPVEKDNKLKEFLISLCKENHKLKHQIAYLKYDRSFAEKKDLLEMEKRITDTITKDIKDNTTSIQKMNSLKFFIYFLFYNFQEKIHYNLKFRNCYNWQLFSISKLPLIRGSLKEVLYND